MPNRKPTERTIRKPMLSPLELRAQDPLENITGLRARALPPVWLKLML